MMYVYEFPKRSSIEKFHLKVCYNHFYLMCRADTGFRRVGPKEYKPRLLQFNDEVQKLYCNSIYYLI